MNRSTLRLLPIGIAVLVVLFQFLTAEKTINPLTGKKARVGLNRQQEERLGLEAYREVLSTERVVERGPAFELVRRVAQRLAGVTGDEAEGFSWAVSVVESPQKNAFCLPGGKIVVYTGILETTQSEAGLAAVMGHEMAHATLRHGGQRVFSSNLTQTLMAGAAMSMSDMDYQQQRTVMAALGAGAKYGVLLPFGREHESEADELGVVYMARAGYDPRESIRFWERMAEAGGSQPPEFMSTHPSHGTRIQRLKDFMPRALEIYEGSRTLER